METSRYRVRFVNSPYSKLRTRSDEPEKRYADSSAGPLTSELSGARRNKPGLAKPGDLESPSQTSVSSQQSPALPLHSNPAHHGIAHGVEQAQEGVGPLVQMEPPAAQIDPGHVPVFFDLNMNFDLLGDEWLAFPQPPIEPPDSDLISRQDDIVGSSPQESTVIIGLEDNSLIQHYLNVMTQYTKIRSSGDENIYTQIFSNMALFYAPLYNAIMAWTALHLGQTRAEPDLVQKAEHRYDNAISLMHQDQEVALHFELSLVTIWFALQFELLAARGVDSFFRHLEFTADLVDAHRRHQKAGGAAAPLGPIGSRVLIWLGTYDARAAWIGGAGRLLQNLELFCSDYDFISAAFPHVQPGADPSDLKSCLHLTFDIDSLDNRIAQLNNRAVVAPIAVLITVQSDLLSLQQRLESAPAFAPILTSIFRPARALSGKVTTRLFNDLLLLSACYSLIISFHRMIPASVEANMPGKLMSAEAAATRILRIASWVYRLRPPSPQNIWPRILFLAGSETTDLVYQDWVIKTLTEAERWGGNFSKIRVLLEDVIQKQSQEGVRVDYLEAMRQSTGLFII